MQQYLFGKSKETNFEFSGGCKMDEEVIGLFNSFSFFASRQTVHVFLVLTDDYVHKYLMVLLEEVSKLLRMTLENSCVLF